MAYTSDVNKEKLDQLDHITVVDNLPDLSNDPRVLEKVEKARAFIKKAGLPKGWDKKKDH